MGVCAPRLQGLGVKVDRERALKLYQAALRAEGQLEGDLAVMGDDTMARLFEAKGKGLLSAKDKKEKAGSAQKAIE